MQEFAIDYKLMMPREPNSIDKQESETEALTQTWEDDQHRRGYYYDDAHGYETFDPDEEDAVDKGDDDDLEVSPKSRPLGTDGCDPEGPN